jgi:DNA-binding transcriptional regulator GbsR (MarR family)
MSSVVSFKVPREVKEKMKKLEKHIKWSEELRNFLIKRVEEVEREVNMREVVEMLKKTRGVPKGYAVALVREDRDIEA